MQSRVALLFRLSQNNRFSIESLFEPLEKQTYIVKYVLPYQLNSFISIVKLFVFSFKIKEKIVHISGDIQYFILFFPWKKTIITVHDLYHLEQLKGVKKIIYRFFWFYLPFKLATKIVAISPNTYNQIIENFPFVKSKIKIIPNTFNKIEINNKIEKDNSYFNILAIGSTSNKNIERLIESVNRLSKIKLIIIGTLSKESLDNLEKLNIHFENFENLKREDLCKKYLIADVLFFASIHEGFGLPILEAQSIGLPIITSNVSSMPFVAGEGATYVNPYSIEEITNAILLIKNNSLIKNDLIEKGFNNVKKFSNEKFINNYQAIYNELSV